MTCNWLGGSSPPPQTTTERESIVTAPAVLGGAALLSPGSGVTQAQSASEPSVIQVRAGQTWIRGSSVQVHLGRAPL